MQQGENAILFKQMEYHEDMSKFGKLGLWILTTIGGMKNIELEDLIGDIPGTTNTENDLSEEEKELLQFAKENGLKYKITSQGLKISH